MTTTLYAHKYTFHYMTSTYIYQQQVFGFSFSDELSFNNFIPGKNSKALGILRKALDNHINAGNQQIFLTGESGSGTTHLLKASCQYAALQGAITAYVSLTESGDQLENIYDTISRFDLVALDDIDMISSDNHIEMIMFELFNMATDNQCALLFAARTSPRHMNIKLPDLQTRLLSCLLLHIEAMDGDDLFNYLKRLFSLHRIRIDSSVIEYILTHCDRSCNHLKQTVKLLEQESLRLHKPITSAFVRSCLNNIEAKSE